MSTDMSITDTWRIQRVDYVKYKCVILIRVVIVQLVHVSESGLLAYLVYMHRIRLAYLYAEQWIRSKANSVSQSVRFCCRLALFIFLSGKDDGILWGSIYYGSCFVGSHVYGSGAGTSTGSGSFTASTTGTSHAGSFSDSGVAHTRSGD